MSQGTSDLDNTAPRAAIQRKGAERERRDLFASRPVEEGGVKETLRPPPPSSFAPSSAVAARNENSVLFKVSDVLGASANARVKTPEPSASPAYSVAPASGASPGSFAPSARDGRDDSGIIDLKALSSAPPRANRAPAPMLFGAPSEPPPAFARDVAASSSFYPQQPGAPKNNLRSIGMIAAGFAVVALCGLGVALAFGGSNPPPKVAAAAPAPPPPPAPPPVVTAAPAAEPAPAASASETKEEKSSKKTATGKKHRAGKGKASAASGVITNKTPPPAAPKVKAADPCHCKGDFNCILACTAGKK